MVNSRFYHFVDSNLEFEIFLKKREYQKRGALKWKIEASQYTLYWGFNKISFTLYTYVLAKILQDGAKFIQKLDSWFQKSHDEFGQLQTSSGKSKKWKFDGLLLPKKYILSAKSF